MVEKIDISSTRNPKPPSNPQPKSKKEKLQTQIQEEEVKKDQPGQPASKRNEDELQLSTDKEEDEVSFEVFEIVLESESDDNNKVIPKALKSLASKEEEEKRIGERGFSSIFLRQESKVTPTFFLNSSIAPTLGGSLR